MKIVELKLTDEKSGQGITAISLVKHPAIEQNWIAFSQGEQTVVPDKRLKFQTVDSEQRVIAGPAMIPDKLIYRKDGDDEYFVFFTKETIRELSERFILNGKQNNMTVEHEATVNDLSVVESWIVEDSEKDKSAVYGYDLPAGSWFVKVKVLNDDIWHLVKNDSVSGFSVEGVFANQLIKQSETMKEKKSKLDEALDKIRSIFASEEAPEAKPEENAEKFGSVEAEGVDGSIEVSFPGEALESGAAITHEVDGEAVPVPTGEYKLSDGTILVVTEEGIAGELKPLEEEQPEEAPEEMETEAGIKSEQIDQLVNGIAEIVANFQKETEAKTAEAINSAVETLRSEFNKEAEEVKPEVPGDPKAKIVMGLNKFVKTQ
jgi:hypothetical protein